MTEHQHGTENEAILEYPDRRIKPIIYAMISSGIRIGAWDFLRWKHVKTFQNENGETVAAKLIVYANEADEYYSFITPEAYKSLKDWMDLTRLCRKDSLKYIPHCSN